MKDGRADDGRAVSRLTSDVDHGRTDESTLAKIIDTFIDLGSSRQIQHEISYEAQRPKRI